MARSVRKIIHIDMDCFYAAIECRDDPSVADKPVGVGGSSRRSVLTTCNYAARAYGCRSAMPVFKALELCPHLIIKPVRGEVYRRESRKVRAIFARYTDLIEPLSLDEAYLDVSHHKRFAYELARQIRREIYQETQLTASAGIAPNKMLAKIASDWRKPNGQFAILPGEVGAFMRALPVRRIPGIGPRAEELLQQKGLRTCGDVQKASIVDLESWFGVSRASELYARCRGKDDRPVEPHRDRKSMSVERTYEQNLSTEQACLEMLPSLLSELESDLEKGEKGRSFHKIFLKLKFSNFQQTTCEQAGRTLDASAYGDLLRTAFARSPHAVRLMGVGVRFREPDPSGQLELEGLMDNLSEGELSPRE
jgi:DNA polymerase-4